MKIAVVIPACEYPDLLPEAIESVYAQSLEADTTIVVVDGKNIERYTSCLNGHSVSSLILPENKGVSAARNKGIQRASDQGCDMVYLLDEDDMLAPYAIERMSYVAGILPDCDIFYPDRCTIGTRLSYEQTPEFDPKLLHQKPYIISSVLMKVEAWQAVKACNGQGFDETLHKQGLRWEDYLFFLEAYYCDVKFCHVGGMAMTLVRLHNNLGSNIANATVPEWNAYADKKLKALYGKT